MAVAACIFGNNTSSGIGVQGSSSSGHGLQGVSAHGFGVVGTTSNTATTSGKAGVEGIDSSPNNPQNSGVYGSSYRGAGVQGVSNGGGNGVLGTGRVGVHGISSGGEGVLGSAVNSFSIGVHGVSNSIGVEADVGGSASADALIAHVGATAGNTATVILSITDGADNIFIGNNSVQDVVSIDAYGNMILAGSLATHGTPRIATGRSAGPNVATFGGRTTTPVVEDFGEGRLTNGQAYVRLDSTFASTIDQHASYFVFVTPHGDTHGLYSTQTSATGFAVRENNDGKSSVQFDYRVVGKPYDTKAMRLPYASAFPQLQNHFVPRRT